ncbi:hypothetical protein [Streptomyces sp. NPDC057677]|uniref:hypothetical protein n=1 Tax=unclassified Streptomyces TaxID=2593676 RepID=UPI003682A01D
MAITVGSVEVDVIPNTQGIYARLHAGLVPAATQVGDDMGRVIARRLETRITPAIRDAINAGAQAAQPSAARQGDNTAGAFSRALKARLEAAFRALPKLTIGADTSEADSDLQALRFRMETLAGKRIGIDIEATAARAEIRLMEAELTRLGASHPNVQVRADTARALAELGAVHAAIDAVDGKRARIDVDTSGAVGAVLHLAVAIGGLAVLPAIPVLAAGIGAIGSAAVAAAVGVGALAAVAVPAFVSIAGALQAQKAAQDAATTSSLRGTQTASKGASSALQMAGAQQALASAHRNAARQIQQAEQSIADAVRSAAEANTRAAQEVKAARQALADTLQQAADRQLSATERVEGAEQSLADAQRDARQAQQDLTQARRDAALELAELGDRLTNAQLSEQDATLSVQEAQERLRASQAKGSKATLLEQQRAQLAYDQAVQRLKEQKAETKRLSAEKAAADKAGVDGSASVKGAEEQLAAAEKSVAEQQEALGKTRVEAARQQVQSQRDIAAAQEKVAESQRNVTRVQEDGARSVARAQESLAAAQQSAADSIASAQRQIASAQQSAASAASGGVDQAAVAQAKYQQALAKLTPTARETFNAFTSLRSAFKAWSESLQPAVMPIFTRALTGMKNSLPGLTPIVLAAAKAIGSLQDRVARGFKSPWWKEFKADFAASVGPAIEGMGVSFGRIFKGMAGIIQAFLPHMDSISARMQAITGRFATWGSSLKGSNKFERFLAYSSQQAPIIAGAFGDIGRALYEVARAASPLSGPILKALGAVASALASIAETLPWLIQLMYAAWVVTKLWTLAMIAFNLVMAANPITLIILGILALVAAVVYAYKNFDWFRNTVQAVWTAIQVAALWAWENVLKPVFEALVTAFKAVADAAVWLWETVLKPVFGFIADAAAILATVVLTILIAPLVLAFKGLAVVAEWLWKTILRPTFQGIAKDATWLWKNILSPIFTAIAAAAKWLWENGIRPAFENFKKGFRQLGDAAKWVWEKVLRPVFGWIGDKATWLWEKAFKPAFGWIKSGIKSVADSFGSASGLIDKAWSKVSDIAKKPVRFIIDKVYNAGIVPTWNLIAKAFGAPEIERMETKGWARGGILPGRSSFRQGDDQLVPMRRGEGVYVSEAMRDPYERARLHAVNQAAMAGKPLSQYQGFAKGGIFDWVGSAASRTVDLAKTGASWLKDGVKASATAGLNSVVEPLIKRISGSASLYRDMVTGIPRKIVKTILGFSGEADKRLGQVGIGSGGFARGLSWARTQAGLPYQWGGNGNPSWDCSGLVSAIESVIRGQSPHRRWATGSFSGKTAPPGWVLNGRSPYRIGITNAGVGHTAGTINGVNVESRGGDGVVIGKGARAWNDKLFTHHYAYQGTYDSGGYLQPGLNLAYNGTGRPEPVFTMSQANALTRAATQGPAGLQPGDSLALVVDGREFTAYVDSRASRQITSTLAPAIAAARAGRKG